RRRAPGSSFARPFRRDTRRHGRASTHAASHRARAIFRWCPAARLRAQHRPLRERSWRDPLSYALSVIGLGLAVKTSRANEKSLLAGGEQAPDVMNASNSDTEDTPVRSALAF